MRGILLGAAVATTVGAIDDFRGLRWWEKLGGQVARGVDPGRASASGSTASRSRSLGVHELPAWVGVPLTVLWIVAVMNMVNFLDGLDGLAAGVCAISGVTFCRDRALARPGRTRRSSRRSSSARASASCATTSIPARIFMGDSGALLLGFMLAAVSVQGLLKTAA